MRFGGWWRWLASAVFVPAVLAGCGTIDLPARPIAHDTEPPPPDSPSNLVARFAWAYNHRDPTMYATLFASDFAFRFALGDSVGNAYANRALTVFEELEFGQNFLVQGTATKPPPTSVSLSFPSLTDNPDSRRGKNAQFHRELPAQTLLRVHQPEFYIAGITFFYVVRGDSARWPSWVAHDGPDSSRWFIDEWDDGTTNGGFAPRRGFQTFPTRSQSWGDLKALYLQ